MIPHRQPLFCFCSSLREPQLLLVPGVVRENARRPSRDGEQVVGATSEVRRVLAVNEKPSGILVADRSCVATARITLFVFLVVPRRTFSAENPPPLFRRRGQRPHQRLQEARRRSRPGLRFTARSRRDRPCEQRSGRTRPGSRTCSALHVGVAVAAFFLRRRGGAAGLLTVTAGPGGRVRVQPIDHGILRRGHKGISVVRDHSLRLKWNPSRGFCARGKRKRSTRSQVL
mmetsp:Transcript_5245/g.13251  ORF Transcript_5245/g.13251 Transcript_5245/m.13251 type:complete len:229 (-) Transcript_5245:166-852(-)